MRCAVLYAPGDVRIDQLDDATVVEPTDAVVRLAATCVCGSDLWPYRGIHAVDEPRPIGHEYCGVVEAVGDAVTTVQAGQFVIGSFITSDNTCALCLAGMHTACLNREGISGAQADLVRVPNADGTLVSTPGMPRDDLIPSLLALSDVMGTGWYAAVAAGVQKGSSVAVVGDGAVGLLGVLAAHELGAGRIIAMSRHESRQQLALEFGATDIVVERGDDGSAAVKELTDGVGADATLECVGTSEAMLQAIHSTRPGGGVGFVGVPHDVQIPGELLFRTQVGLRGGPAPVRRFLPDLVAMTWNGTIEPGKVFDLELPLEDVAAGYRAMDERTAIKVLLRV
jgi:threonine dehydrogenase-like Zn-dependent dehydrogenase